MDSFDHVSQTTAVSGWQPLLSLGIFAAVGSFFLGALYTAVRRGMKEEGWFKFTNKEDE